MQVLYGITKIKCIGCIGQQIFFKFYYQRLLLQLNLRLFLHWGRDDQFLVYIVQNNELIKSDPDPFSLESCGIVWRVTLQSHRRILITGATCRIPLLGTAPANTQNAK